MQKVPRHSEVDQENATGFEPKNQILAAAIKCGDPLSLKLGGHSGGVERAGKARIEDLDALQTAPDEQRLQACADGLYLG